MLLGRLALIGSADFGEWAAAPLLDADLNAAVEFLEELVESQLVQARSDRGATRFRLHDLIRIYAGERLATEQPLAERKAATERLLGCWLALTEGIARQRGGHCPAMRPGNCSPIRSTGSPLSGRASFPPSCWRRRPIWTTCAGTWR